MGFGQGIAEQGAQPAQRVKPGPAAHGVERIAGGVARPCLDLGVLVGDEVAAHQLAGGKAVVEGEEIERRRQNQQSGAGPDGRAPLSAELVNAGNIH